MARGDHLRVRRRGYWHHAIDCGGGAVIHYAGEVREKSDAYVRRTPLSDFAKGRPVHVVKGSGDDPELAVTRAESMLGSGRYHLLFNNCEHFAAWCATGRRSSRQLTSLLTLGADSVLRLGLSGAARVLAALRR